MQSIGSISAANASVTQAASSRAAANAARMDVEGQVQSVKASAAPGTATSVQYSYETGPNGELIPVSARVTSTQQTKPTETPQQAPALTGGGNLLALSPADEMDAFGLTAEERDAVRELQTRDLEVRVHEGQHLDAAGGLASGGPTFTFQTGPDGKQYAVGGHVDIQTSATTDPEKAARDAQTFANAASAPGDASAQDNSVARSGLNNAAISNTAQPDEPKNDGVARTPLDITV